MSYKRFTKKDAEDLNLSSDDPIIGRIVYVHEKKDKRHTETVEDALNKLFELRGLDNEK